MERAIEFGVIKQCDPDWRVTIQAPQTMPDGLTVVPGYVQIDDVSGGVNHWSRGPDALRAMGYDVPAGMDALPNGRYLMAEFMR